MLMDEDEYSDLLSPGAGSIFGSAATEETLGGLGFFDDSPPVAVSGLGAVSKDQTSIAPSPTPTTQNSKASVGAALTLFTLVGGGLIGYRMRKWKGAAGGALAGAGARNLWRAQGAMRSSDLATKAGSVQQGLIGLAGVLAGAYLLFSKE